MGSGGSGPLGGTASAHRADGGIDRVYLHPWAGVKVHTVIEVSRQVIVLIGYEAPARGVCVIVLLSPRL